MAVDARLKHERDMKGEIMEKKIVLIDRNDDDVDVDLVDGWPLNKKNDLAKKKT